MSTENVFATGSCDCKAIQYNLQQRPLTVHCCHCTWCQRETGSAFCLNAVIEAKHVQLVTPTNLEPDSAKAAAAALEPRAVKVPSSSGRGQTIFRCPLCFVALWSIYGEEGPVVYVRVGTLDDPNVAPPELHIFTSTKQKWLNLSEEKIPVLEEYYDNKVYWRPESLERMKALFNGGPKQG